MWTCLRYQCFSRNVVEQLQSAVAEWTCLVNASRQLTMLPDAVRRSCCEEVLTDTDTDGSRIQPRSAWSAWWSVIAWYSDERKYNHRAELHPFIPFVYRISIYDAIERRKHCFLIRKYNQIDLLHIKSTQNEKKKKKGLNIFKWYITNNMKMVMWNKKN